MRQSLDDHVRDIAERWTRMTFGMILVVTALIMWFALHDFYSVVVSAYGGFYWLGRLAGLGRFVAQVPALIFVTSAYYVTLIYGRGDWPEFVAVSSMPLLVA